MDYRKYYLEQAGGQYTVFRGAERQRGYGLGGIFKSLYKYILPLFKSHALPVIKKGAQVVGTEAIRAANNIANDALKGVNVKDSIKQHTTAVVDNLSNQAQAKLQSGSGKRKPIKRTKKSNNNKASKKTRRLEDVFDRKHF
jgi:hypothetical protein